MHTLTVSHPYYSHRFSFSWAVHRIGSQRTVKGWNLPQPPRVARSQPISSFKIALYIWILKVCVRTSRRLWIRPTRRRLPTWCPGWLSCLAKASPFPLSSSASHPWHRWEDIPTHSLPVSYAHTYMHTYIECDGHRCIQVSGAVYKQFLCAKRRPRRAMASRSFGKSRLLKF